MDRQLKKLDEIQKVKKDRFGIIDKEEKKREQRIEKKIDHLLK